MAGSSGNQHFLKMSEWGNILEGRAGPWCKVAVDQSKMHPNGGTLRVVVVDEYMRQDVTKVVVKMAAKGN